MQAWMWRLTDEHAVLYTDDRATLKALFAYSRFPHQDLSRATTYEGKNGRVFAWQFTFPMSAWNGVVRFLGRASITMLDQDRPASGPAASALKTTAPLLPVAPPARGKKRAPESRSQPEPALPAREGTRPRPEKAVADLSQPLQPMAAPAGPRPARVRQKEAAAPATPPVTSASQSRSASSRNGARASVLEAPAATSERPQTKKRRGSDAGEAAEAPAKGSKLTPEEAAPPVSRTKRTAAKEPAGVPKPPVARRPRKSEAPEPAVPPKTEIPIPTAKQPAPKSSPPAEATSGSTRSRAGRRSAVPQASAHDPKPEPRSVEDAAGSAAARKSRKAVKSLPVEAAQPTLPTISAAPPKPTRAAAGKKEEADSGSALEKLEKRSGRMAEEALPQRGRTRAAGGPAPAAPAAVVVAPVVVAPASRAKSGMGPVPALKPESAAAKRRAPKPVAAPVVLPEPAVGKARRKGSAKPG